MSAMVSLLFKQFNEAGQNNLINKAFVLEESNLDDSLRGVSIQEKRWRQPCDTAVTVNK